MAKNNRLTPEKYIESLELCNQMSEKAIREAIHQLGLFPGCKILDIPCGIGNQAVWMKEENNDIELIGADFSEEHLEYAKDKIDKKGISNNIAFEKQDINKLGYKDNSFDFIWCADGLWLGSIKEGFIAEEPYAIIDEMVRITKNKGTIAIVFWSSQKILPGYPLIESSLNATLTANRALYPRMEPELHFMKASSWLKKAGLQNIQSRTFASDIKNFPLNLASMFWGRAEQEVSPEVWGKYKKISDKDSEEYPFNNDDYTGFLTYTMFTGQVSK